MSDADELLRLLEEADIDLHDRMTANPATAVSDWFDHWRRTHLHDQRLLGLLRTRANISRGFHVASPPGPVTLVLNAEFVSVGSSTVERATVTNNNINNTGGSIAGSAFGTGASAKAGDITSTVGSGNTAIESFAQAIAGARSFLAQCSQITDEDKEATGRALDNLEREVAHDKPNAGIIAGAWNTLLLVAKIAATAKPFVEIGLLLAKAGFIPGLAPVSP